MTNSLNKRCAHALAVPGRRVTALDRGAGCWKTHCTIKTFNRPKVCEFLMDVRCVKNTDAVASCTHDERFNIPVAHLCVPRMREYVVCVWRNNAHVQRAAVFGLSDFTITLILGQRQCCARAVYVICIKYERMYLHLNRD